MADDLLLHLAAFHGQVFPSFMALMPYLFLCPSKYSWSIRHVIARGIFVPSMLIIIITWLSSAGAGSILKYRLVYRASSCRCS